MFERLDRGPDRQRRTSFSSLLALVLVLTGSVAAVFGGREASARTTTVRVRVTPNPVRAGSMLQVSATVRPSGRSCSLQVRPAGATIPVLPIKRAVGGSVGWRFHIANSVSAPHDSLGTRASRPHLTSTRTSSTTQNTQPPSWNGWRAGSGVCSLRPIPLLPNQRQ